MLFHFGLALLIMLGWLIALSIGNRTYAHVVAITPVISGSSTPAATFNPATNPAAGSAQHSKAVVAVGAANIRSGPGTNYSRLGVVRRSEELTVTGQRSNCRWLRVITRKGQSGWILGSLTRLNTSCRLIPTVVPSPIQTTPAAPVVPTLVKPDDGASVFGMTTFIWEWSGPALTANQAFEVRIWAEGQRYHYGAADPVRGTRATFDVAGAFGVQQGGVGRSYYWTVALIETDPYTQNGQEAPRRAILVNMSQISPNTPTPTPAATPSPTLIPVDTPSPTPIPVDTPSPTPPATPSPTPSATLIPPFTPTPTASGTMTPTPTLTPTRYYQDRRDRAVGRK